MGEFVGSVKDFLHNLPEKDRKIGETYRIRQSDFVLWGHFFNGISDKDFYIEMTSYGKTGVSIVEKEEMEAIDRQDFNEVLNRYYVSSIQYDGEWLSSNIETVLTEQKPVEIKGTQEVRWGLSTKFFELFNNFKETGITVSQSQVITKLLNPILGLTVTLNRRKMFYDNAHPEISSRLAPKELLLIDEFLNEAIPDRLDGLCGMTLESFSIEQRDGRCLNVRLRFYTKKLLCPLKEQFEAFKKDLIKKAKNVLG